MEFRFRFSSANGQIGNRTSLSIYSFFDVNSKWDFDMYQCVWNKRTRTMYTHLKSTRLERLAAGQRGKAK